MSARTARAKANRRQQANPTGWDRARLGVVVPLCVVVAAAIVCIIVAALTSAQRADEVALERERQLFLKGISNRAEWSLRKLRTVAPSAVAIRLADIEALKQHVGRWLPTLQDHDQVVVADPDGPLYSIAVNDDGAFWNRIAGSEITPLLQYVRGERAELPAQVMPLTPGSSDGLEARVPASYAQSVFGRVCLVSVTRLAVDVDSSGAHHAPVVLAIMFLDEELPEIGQRLAIANLRMVDADAPPQPNDHVFPLLDSHGSPIASVAWTPQRPGAEVLHSVFPFIGIALAGFALLASLVLRYMRRTAATIIAGETRLRHLALHDPLCGLPNRMYFSERLEALLADVKRGGAPAAVFYIDLDHFKDVNDTLGHPIGDELIRSVSLRLPRAAGQHDLVARLGGDEFAVITSSTTDHASLHDMATHLIATLCAPYTVNGHTIVIGASIGIAVVDRRSDGDAADIMRYADMALYRAKSEGRNRACIYDAAMDADLSNRKLIEQELREAIEHDRLNVVYQPITNASGETVVAVEALARWPHPTRGLVSPTEFIPIAEHSGLIIPLGANVLRRACLDARAWGTLTVSVNVSPLQFRQLDFVDSVEAILKETALDPARLELELTESTLIGNLDTAEAAMRRLKAIGVRLALDDFGTGYSSLQYLRRFPFDRLKIDRSFVLSIEKSADAAAIVHAVVSLGRGLGMKVTAEGVETAEQHLFLRAAGVHCMQGYRFGVPCAPADIAQRIATPGVYRSIEGDAAAALAG